MRARGYGGIIGGANIPSTTSAPGNWHPNTAARQLNQAGNVLRWPTLKDPDFASVSLLCHFDEWAGNDLVNRGNGSAVSPIGATVSNAQAKFRNLSFFGNAAVSTGFSQCASHAAFNYGSGNFSIEFWIYCLNNATGTPYDQRPSSTNGVYPLLYLASAGNMNYYVNSGDRITGSGAPITANAWHFIQLIKDTGTTRLYVDAVQHGADYTDGNTYLQSPVTIGNSGFSPVAIFSGYLQEMRITKGIARPVAVPTAPFPDW